MRECNICERRSCVIIRGIRKGVKYMTDEQSQAQLCRHCPSAIMPEPWKQPIVLTALVTHPQGVHDVLQAHDMYFQEETQKPYFRILLRSIH